MARSRFAAYLGVRQALSSNSNPRRTGDSRPAGLVRRIQRRRPRVAPRLGCEQLGQSARPWSSLMATKTGCVGASRPLHAIWSNAVTGRTSPALFACRCAPAALALETDGLFQSANGVVGSVTAAYSVQQLSNKGLKRTRRGTDGASPLNPVFGGRGRVVVKRKASARVSP